MPETNNNAYIIAAYAVTWIVLIGYALRVLRLAKRAAERQAELENGQGRNP
jgi:hypothetical protein